MAVNDNKLEVLPGGRSELGPLSVPVPHDKIACFTFVMGCPRSMIDASLLMDYFRLNGWEITTEIRRAKLVLVGTCGFSSGAEEKSINYLLITERLKSKEAKLVVFGCLAGINKDRIIREADAIVIEPKNLDKLDDIIHATIKLKDVKDPNIIDTTILKKTKSYTIFQRAQSKTKLMMKFINKSLTCAILGRGDGHIDCSNAYSIRIAKGCMGNCSYCAIKIASGSLQSKPLDKILAEFERGLEQGYQLFHLIGQDIGSYGQDINTDIVALLTRIFQRQENFQLIWDDFNPYWLIQYFPDLKKLFMENVNRIVHFGFPIQSGSERILKLMNRVYTAADALNCLSELRQAFPEALMTTHVLVGFPSETNDDFKETERFLRTVPFDQVGVYKYDARPNTLAIQLPGQVPELTKYWRLCKLRYKFKNASSIQD
jgi:tRNA A37 methylthiotransferase MiaB